MILRKRKSANKQAETFIHSADNIDKGASSISTEEGRAVNGNLRSGKRVKLEETKTLLNEIIKSEDDNVSFEEHEITWEETDKYVNSNEVSEKVVFKLKDPSNVDLL